jgi:hypothetical protein
VDDHHSNTTLVQPMHYIQCLCITTLTIFLHLGPKYFDPVGSSSGTRSNLKIKFTHTAVTAYVVEQEMVGYYGVLLVWFSVCALRNRS